MKTLQWHEILSLAVKQSGKWAVYVANHLDICDDPKDEEIYLWVMDKFKEMYDDTRTKENHMNSVCDEARMAMMHSGLVLLDTEEEMLKFYNVFEQPLTDSSGVYACTFGPDGECLTENT